MNFLLNTETLWELPFNKSTTVMGPRIGNTRTYMSDGVACSCLGVTRTVSETWDTCSLEGDALVRL